MKKKRKTRKSKTVAVKGFTRNGKRVKGYRRKK